MDMMKRKQLTSKDGGDVKATKTDDQEQAWCKKDKKNLLKEFKLLKR